MKSKTKTSVSSLTKNLVFSCGYAGALAQDLEKTISTHGFGEEYQTHLQDSINLGWSNNTGQSYVVPGQKSLAECLSVDVRTNAQIRMNAAAKTLLYKGVGQELNLKGYTMGGLCCAIVKEPSKTQLVKDSFKSNSLFTSLFGIQKGEAGFGRLNKKGMYIDANGMLGENSRELAMKNLGGMQSIRTNMQKYKKSGQSPAVILT